LLALQRPSSTKVPTLQSPSTVITFIRCLINHHPPTRPPTHRYIAPLAASIKSAAESWIANLGAAMLKTTQKNIEATLERIATWRTCLDQDANDLETLKRILSAIQEINDVKLEVELSNQAASEACVGQHSTSLLFHWTASNIAPSTSSHPH
jgi:hypothetical protein